MSNTVIKVEKLGKKYVIKHQQEKSANYVALRDVMANGVKAFGRKVLKPKGKTANSAREEFWALKDVSFEINRGDRVGIIGRNGAGKSTLLKILSRITEPTTGRITLKGRVASLLEVGTGFHPELTGRENIYLNGAVLGMSKAEIKKKFDEIVSFAEVEKFLDTPVKRYSSGMYVRLAFAVAAHLEPEILIVDEVLAVGDAAFQKKCLGKMKEVGKDGRTVIFVSHNMGAIKTLCSRATLLSNGNIVLSGYPDEVIALYLKENLDLGSSNLAIWVNQKNALEDSTEVSLLSVRLRDSSGNFQNTYACDEAVVVAIDYQVNSTVTGLRIAVQLQTSEGIIAFTSYEDSSVVESRAVSPGEYQAECTLPPNFLNIDTYFVLVAIDLPKNKALVSLTPTVNLKILETNSRFSYYYQTPKGVVRPNLNWKTDPHGGTCAR